MKYLFITLYKQVKNSNIKQQKSKKKKLLVISCAFKNCIYHIGNF